MPTPKHQKRTEAAIRQEARNSRSAGEQLKLLDRRLGPGVGAAKERARLDNGRKRPKRKRQAHAPQA